MIHTARRSAPVNGDRANGTAHDTNATEGQDMTDTDTVDIGTLIEYAQTSDLRDDPLIIDMVAAIAAVSADRDGLAADIAQTDHGTSCPTYMGADDDPCFCPKSAVPSDALAKVKREAASRALDDAVAEWMADPAAWGDNDRDYRNELRDRAAAIRAHRGD